MIQKSYITQVDFIQRSNKKKKKKNHRIKMSCFSKFFKSHKSFDLPVMETAPESNTKVISFEIFLSSFCYHCLCHHELFVCVCARASETRASILSKEMM